MTVPSKKRTLSWARTHLDEGDNILVVFIDELGNVFEEVCKKLETNEYKKVIFKITHNENVLRMKGFIKQLQDLNHAKSLPAILQKFATYDELPNSDVWPNSWYTHIFLEGSWSVNITIIPVMWTLPNIEVLSCRCCVMDDMTNISFLNGLKILNLERNELRSLPTTLSLCKTLEVLKVGDSLLRGLPFCITKIESLQTITRLNMVGVDPMVVNDLFPIKEIHSCEENEEDSLEQADQQLKDCPETLFDLAAFEILKSSDNVLSSSFSHKFPEDVMKDIARSFKVMKICDNCSRGFSSNKYRTVRKEFREFRGYKNLVFEAVTCSNDCCDAIYDDWYEKARVEQRQQYKIQYCFDVEPKSREEARRYVPVKYSPTQRGYRKCLCCYVQV